jgi:uncharacterized protein DUF2784
MRKMNRYLLLADGVAVFHAAYVAFVTIGFALIAAGIVMRWEWARAFWFRVAHLGAIAFVCAESLMGTACPLTTLEGQLRAMSGEASHSRDFVCYWVDRLIYYDFPPWAFVVAYAVFGILVAIGFILAPPRWPRYRTAASASAGSQKNSSDCESPRL